MAPRPKAKPKRKSQKGTDDKQSARFIETARALMVDESGKDFGRALAKVLKPSKRRG